MIQKALGIDEKETGVYMYPWAVFSAEELANDPDIIYRRLSKEEEADRAGAAAGRIRAALDDLFKRLKIKRPGLSWKSFRHTDVSEWLAAGTPTPVIIPVLGLSEEKNIWHYASTTISQLKSVAELTWDVWRYPGRRVWHTITQAVVTLIRVIIKSEIRQRRAINKVHEEVRALRADLEKLRPDWDHCAGLLPGIDSGKASTLSILPSKAMARPDPSVQSDAMQMEFSAWSADAVCSTHCLQLPMPTRDAA